MTPSMDARADHDAAELLRGDLAAAGFSVSALTALWGEQADAALQRGHRVPALRAIERTSSALSTLAAVFVLGVTVPREAFAAAVPRLGLDGAAALGLVRVEGESAHPLVDLRPYAFTDRLGDAEWWIASDLGEVALASPIDEGHVLGIGGASMTLAGLMLQRPVRRALDLGTGCGIQALHAARHAEHVVATDISRRALWFARFNASLNGVRNIEFRLGSLFEPVAGERFDHIVSNPPFVITPRAPGVPEYEYRDGGMVGDAIVAAVVTGAAAHLTPGGVVQLLGNWEYRTGVHAYERIGGWLDSSDPGADVSEGDGERSRGVLDAWVIEREVQDPAEYAETWIRDGGIRPGDEFDRLERMWLDDFERRDVRQIGFGYMTLRRGDGGLRRVERWQGPAGAGGLGEHLESCLAARDAIAALDDEALAGLAMIVADDVTEERHLRPGDDDPTVMLLRQGGGLGRVVTLDTALAAMVGASDGSLSLARLADAIGELMEVSAVDVLAQCLPRIRELVETGFLRPAGDGRH